MVSIVLSEISNPTAHAKTHPAKLKPPSNCHSHQNDGHLFCFRHSSPRRALLEWTKKKNCPPVPLTSAWLLSEIITITSRLKQPKKNGGKYKWYLFWFTAIKNDDLNKRKRAHQKNHHLHWVALRSNWHWLAGGGGLKKRNRHYQIQLASQPARLPRELVYCRDTI